MAQPLVRTLLSLESFRSIIGVNPAHWQGAAGATYFPLLNDCNDLFTHWYWQNTQNVSREEINRAIKDAEDEIARVLNYSPAPIWIEQVADYPRPYRRDVWQWGMNDVRGMDKSVQLQYGKFIQGGQRAVSAVQLAAAVVRTDADGDGYAETATITANTTLTEACEIHCYFAGNSGAQEWEIRTPRSVTLSGGVITFVFWSWQLIDPDLQQAFPITTNITSSTPYGVATINLEANGSYVTTVDVYREYNDFTQASAQFFWERVQLISLGLIPIGWCCSACDGSGCPACEFITQDGCLHVKDANGAFGVPAPAEYDSDAEQWNRVVPSVCRDPDLVKFWYYSGDLSQEYLAGRTCEPLSHYWAETIAWLAVARVNRPFCTCNNSLTLTNELQRDLSFTGSRQLGSYTVSPSDLDNPFGTRMGEIKAWKRVNRLQGQLMMGLAV